MTGAGFPTATFEDWIESSNREILGEIDGTGSSGEQIDGRIFSHGDNQMAAITTSNIPFLHLQYEYSVVPNMALKNQVESQDLPEPGPNETIQIDAEVGEAHIKQAQDQVAAFLGDQDRETLQKIRSKLVESIAHPDIAYEIRDDLNGPHGFKISRKIFPEHDTVAEFDRSAQKIMNQGILGQKFLGNVFNTDIELETGTNKESQIGTDVRGFQ